MFSPNIELKFADRLSYVNNFMPYDSRFSLPLIVSIRYDLNIIKGKFYQLKIFLVIQHIPAFICLTPLGSDAFGFVLQIFVKSKVDSNLVVSMVK